jgi:hypothetical protein
MTFMVQSYNKYPLMTSKSLDYLCLLKGLNIKQYI